MLLDYADCASQYANAYQISQALHDKRLFRIERGIYATTPHVSELAIIQKKYPKAIFTMDSAFYYHGLTDTIPTKYYLTTDKDSSKIKDNRVKQSFENSDYLELGKEDAEVDGVTVKMYSKERMLVELVRNKNKIPFDYYKEIISSYRKIINKLDIQAVQEYAKLLPKTNKVIDTLELEVF